MKIASVLLLLVLVSVANANFFSFFKVDELKAMVQTVIAVAGSDATESKCEEVCVDIVHNPIGQAGCDAFCKAFQTLVVKFGLKH